MLITGTTYDNDRLTNCNFYDETNSTFCKTTTAPSQVLYRVLDIISMILHNLEIYESDRDLFVHWSAALKLLRKWKQPPPPDPSGIGEDDIWTGASVKVFI